MRMLKFTFPQKKHFKLRSSKSHFVLQPVEMVRP